jgi:phage gp46-like protein
MRLLAAVQLLLVRAMYLRGNVTNTVHIEQWNDIRVLVLMSIGTDKGTWWADPNFGSELWLLRKTGKVDGGNPGADDSGFPSMAYKG